ncbi:hypothetical protein J5N97_015330 [Dioscorea zingiberensis]|uniref:Uncharacterized protein n=1 Tax=Dioscorea zingiberensis TaxID=325984 RepID=A0A9D5CUH9_9LILI|nr:hypothetical protein J5N97_015330 [Dioscorea zingiberensis]
MENSTIHIYNVWVDEVKTKLNGHQKHITGLAFSNNHNILVSSGADAQLCIWNTVSWEKKKSIAIQLPAGRIPQFMIPPRQNVFISGFPKAVLLPQYHMQYLCNSQLVYAAFCDGNVSVFGAENLRLRCRIAPSAYLSLAAVNSFEFLTAVVELDIFLLHEYSGPILQKQNNDGMFISRCSDPRSTHW